MTAHTQLSSPPRPLARLALALAITAAACTSNNAADAPDAAIQAPKQYANQPTFTAPNMRVDSYLDVLPSSLGPAIDPAKGYYTAEIAGGVHWVTDGIYQSMFIVTTDGVVV